MKNLKLFLSAIMLLFPLLSASAQFIPEDIENKNIGETIGKEIERLVERLQWKWNFDNTARYCEEDTIPVTTEEPDDFFDMEMQEDAQVFTTDKVVQESDTVNGNIVVKGGNLIVYGVINGNVQIIGGDLHLKPTGKITGNTRVIDGSIIKAEGAVIKGYYEERSSADRTDYRESKTTSRSSHNFDVLWNKEQIGLENFVFRYNRVESIFLGLGTDKKYYWDGEKEWNAYGSMGWGFKSHTWRGNLGLVRQFAFPSENGSSIFELGVEGYTLTDTKDQWIISQHENTAAALFIHEDFRNYFERNGFTIHTAFYTKRNYLKGELKLAYLIDSYDSLSSKIDWALFGGNKKFRSNPIIDPGKMRSLMVSGGISTVTKTSRAQEGWCLFGSAEYARKSWGGEFNFDHYIIDLRRFQPLGRYENLNMRVRLGSSSGTLPIQKQFELGGFGTMNAFPFKSETGNRMMLVNMEFILNGNIFDDLVFWPTWLFKHVNIILISDAGFTRSVLPGSSAAEGFGGIKLKEFQHNFGVAVGSQTGTYRIGVAWRTDISAPVQFILRFMRPF